MNIDLLSKMVREHILDNDSVVLPGFGVFIAEIVPASFSDKGYTLNPPYRRLHFRAKDVQDDVLATLYASSNDVELAVARTIVQDFVSELKKVLQKNKVVVFPGLGRLRATKENNFFFVPDADLDIYPEGFGLEPISLKTHQETEEEVAAAVGDLAGILKDEQVVTEESGNIGQEAGMTGEESEEMDLKSEGTMPEETAPEVPMPEVSVPEEVAVTENTVADGKPRTDAVQEKQSRDGRKTLKTVLVVAGVVAGVLVLALLAFLVVAEACPDFMDSVLYNKEELEILKQWEHIGG